MLKGFSFNRNTKRRKTSGKKRLRCDWEKENYDEEEDAFLRQFDEYGNFIELPPEEIVPDDAMQITYHHKENKESDPLE